MIIPDGYCPECYRAICPHCRSHQTRITASYLYRGSTHTKARYDCAGCGARFFLVCPNNLYRSILALRNGPPSGTGGVRPGAGRPKETDA